MRTQPDLLGPAVSPVVATRRSLHCIHAQVGGTILSMAEVVMTIAQSMAQSGGQDSGLIMLDSLRVWPKHGWIAGKP